ncbi:hypothetical protein [Vibrio sp. B1Z05]|uniref:hypothetical protein n=1 Tax=Vibrio sp. B1Z05 TaxID=2654980 RepID=UPI00128C35D8|nr:hypothetical protein [Vibrio sp. B1Z05]MPW37357.1 hypothetical protein [Vibrio sp. B1Z05]
MNNIVKFIGCIRRYIIFITLISISFGAYSAQYKLYKHNNDANKSTLIINGNIENGEYGKFVKFISEITDNISSVILQSNGGYLNDAIEIANYINKSGWNTDVETYCNSCCVIIFLSGKHRTAYEKSHIGAHSPYYGDLKRDYRQDLKKSALYNRLFNILSRYLNDIKISKQIIDQMYDTPSRNRLELNTNNHDHPWEIITKSFLYS